MNREEIAARIPHRAPFLLLDEVETLTAESIEAAVTLRPDDELWSRIYAGHYPGNPITPGVLLCEMLFQAAAVLLAKAAEEAGLSGVPVVTRIHNVKFRNIVPPESRLAIRAILNERLANAFFMKGDIRRDGKIVLQAEFAVALSDVNG